MGDWKKYPNVVSSMIWFLWKELDFWQSYLALENHIYKSYVYGLKVTYFLHIYNSRFFLLS